MFFIGIFGIESKQKEIKILNSIPCKNCQEVQGGKLIKSFSFFHFFFIPLFRWNEKYYIICNGCNSVYEIPQDKGKKIEKGEDIEITYWDLKAAESQYDSGYYSSENRCKHCGKVIDSSFEYCPYCGEKIK